MCCLAFEYDTYCELKKEFPDCGRIVQTEKGKGRVVRHELLRGCVGVQLDDGTELEFPLSGIREVKPNQGIDKNRIFHDSKSKRKKTRKKK